MALVLRRKDGHAHKIPKVLVIGESERIALFVPHASGWYFYPLTPRADIVQCNSQPLTSGVRLTVGDLVRVGRIKAVVEEATVDSVSAVEAANELTACTLIAGGRMATVRDGILLLGTAPHCGLRLPAGADSVHALVARAEGRWVLYDVSGDMILRADGKKRCWVVLTDGAEHQIGSAKVVVEIGMAVDAPASTASTFDPQDACADPEEIEEDAAAIDTFVAEAAETQSVNEPAPVAAPDPHRQDAERVCQWLRSVHKQPDRVATAPTLPPRGGLRRLIDPGMAFVALLHDVVAGPRNPVVLLRFASELSARGYLDLYRHVLRRLFFLNQNNAPVALLLAEAHLRAGRAATTRDDRIHLLEEAERYWEKAEELMGVTPELHQLGTDIQAELSIARLTRP